MLFHLEDIRVDISNKDSILALTMGLDKSYDSFIIFLNITPPYQLTLNYVISCMLNEEVHHNNVEIQGVAVKAKGSMVSEKAKVRVKKEKNVVLVATQGDWPTMCWRCGKLGHLKAFCMARPICGKEAGHVNVAMAAIGLDSDLEYLTEVSDNKD